MGREVISPLTQVKAQYAFENYRGSMNEQTALDPQSKVVRAPGDDVIELDARGFEPPQPLLKTLEAIATLPSGATLRLHTRWKPAMLFPELEKRGFVSQSQEQPDGSCITQIRHC